MPSTGALLYRPAPTACRSASISTVETITVRFQYNQLCPIWRDQIWKLGASRLADTEAPGRPMTRRPRTGRERGYAPNFEYILRNSREHNPRKCPPAQGLAPTGNSACSSTRGSPFAILNMAVAGVYRASPNGSPIPHAPTHRKYQRSTCRDPDEPACSIIQLTQDWLSSERTTHGRCAVRKRPLGTP